MYFKKINIKKTLHNIFLWVANIVIVQENA